MELFGVFKRLTNGSRLWVGSTSNLNAAKTKMQDDAQKTGLEHLVYDFSLERTVATSLGEKTPAGDVTE
jgi:hypothetical protein